MAVESPAFANQNSTYGAEQTRRAVASLLQRGASIGSIEGGLVATGDCQLSPPGSGMSVTVAPGELWVPGSSSTTQSGYYCRVSSSTSLAIAASDPTNPRVDTVSALITDSAYSGATNTFAVAVETGTPTAGATLVNLNGAAAAPASSLPLGYVLVPPSSTSVTGANISNVAATVALNTVTVASGQNFVTTSQATSSTSYTTLATPDELSITMPYRGIIAVFYQATWQESVAGAGKAAIFLSTNQVEAANTTSVAVLETGVGDSSTAATNRPLFSTATGLQSLPSSASGYTGDVTTGQIVGGFGASGGPCWVFANGPATYTVSVQFKASSGSVTASNRKLWAVAFSFGI